MGLALEVGILADLDLNDSEAATEFTQHFEKLNTHLASLGIPQHFEPRDCDVWSGEMYGYTGLHYLRRTAAHLDSTGYLPGPGDDSSAGDPVLEAYFNDVLNVKPSILRRMFEKRRSFRRRFDHVIVHSDAEGFYLPVDFSEVLILPGAGIVPGSMVGSVPRLLDELDRLGQALQIPEALISTSDELWEAADSQGEGDSLWQQYGIESFSCVVLREACRHSLRTGAAIVFT
jgi:hypothetical protein